jgi:hypothetical protein
MTLSWRAEATASVSLGVNLVFGGSLGGPTTCRAPHFNGRCPDKRVVRRLRRSAACAPVNRSPDRFIPFHLSRGKESSQGAPWSRTTAADPTAQSRCDDGGRLGSFGHRPLWFLKARVNSTPGIWRGGD